MNIELDPHSPIPIYQQLHDRIVEAMAAGDLVRDQSLASVRQVAVSFGINVATVAKAYDALRQQGFIHTNRKSGSVVARAPDTGTEPVFKADWQTRLTTLLAEAVAHGVPDAEVLDSCRQTLDAFAARRQHTAAPQTSRPAAPDASAGDPS